MTRISANFEFLKKHDAQLVLLGGQAERYFKEDPNTCLIKLRQFTELLAQRTAAKAGMLASTEEPQADLLRRLKFERIMPNEVGDLFRQIRQSGNRATHAHLGNHGEALSALKIGRELGVWFHRTFADAVSRRVLLRRRQIRSTLQKFCRTNWTACDRFWTRPVQMPKKPALPPRPKPESG